MEFTKLVYDFSFTTWYYTLQNEHLLEYDIFSYWSENGGLDILFNKLPLSDTLQIGEIFFFDFDSNEVFGTARNFTKDFNTNHFQIIEIKNGFIEFKDGVISMYKTFELAPLDRKI